MRDRILLTDKLLGDEDAVMSLGASAVDVRLCRAGRAAHDQAVGIPGQWRRAMATLQWSAKMPALQVSIVSPVNDDVLSDASHFASLVALLPHVRWRLEVPSMYPEVRWFQIVQKMYEACEAKGIELALSDAVSVLDGPIQKEFDVLSATGLGLIEMGGFWAQSGTVLQLPKRHMALQRLELDRKGLSNVGLKMALYGFPIGDLPQCLGGLGQARPSGETLYGSECDDCVHRTTCVGVPKDVGMLLSNDSDVCPLPFWTGMVAHPRVAISAQIPKVHQRCMALMQRWEEYGAVSCAATDSPDYHLVGSIAEADALLDLDRMLQSGTRIVIWDHSSDASFSEIAKRFDPNGRRFRGVDWWPHPQLLLLSSVPERVREYRDLGLPLRWIRFIHWPEQEAESTLPFIASGWFQPTGLETDDELYQNIVQSRFVVMAGINGTRFHEIMALAGACGRVAVCLSSFESRFWIHHKRNGLLARSPNEVSKMVTLLHEDSELLSRLTVNARRLSRRRTISALADSLFHGFS